MGARADGVRSTREAIVREATQLFKQERYDDVTLAEIASAAGVSHQTVLNHFASKEGVVLAVAEVIATETHERREPRGESDVAGAVRILMRDYEQTGDANFGWAETADRHAVLAPIMDGARASHQAWLGDVLASRLAASSAARKRQLNALHVATDVYTWKLLRRDLRLSRAETERTMVQLAEGVLARDHDNDSNNQKEPRDHDHQPRSRRPRRAGRRAGQIL